jgi:hypothetical protein
MADIIFIYEIIMDWFIWKVLLAFFCVFSISYYIKPVLKPLEYLYTFLLLILNQVLEFILELLGHIILMTFFNILARLGLLTYQIEWSLGNQTSIAVIDLVLVLMLYPLYKKLLLITYKQRTLWFYLLVYLMLWIIPIGYRWITMISQGGFEYLH